MSQVLPEGWTVGTSTQGREYYYMHTDAVPIALGLLQVQHYIPRVSAMFFFFNFCLFPSFPPPFFGLMTLFQQDASVVLLWYLCMVVVW